MKNRKLFFMAAGLIMMFAGCNNIEKGPEDEPQKEEETVIDNVSKLPKYQEPDYSVYADVEIKNKKAAANVVYEELNYEYKALADLDVKKTGRTFYDSDTLFLSLTGSGIEFNFEGKYLAVSVAGSYSSSEDSFPRIAAFIDGEKVQDHLITTRDGKKIVLINQTEKKTCTVKIAKLSEGQSSSCGIKGLSFDDSALITKTAARTHSIEVIGDSITCGYGVDDENKDHSFKTSTEDFTRAYESKIIEYFDADYSIISISGFGIVSGWIQEGKSAANKAAVFKSSTYTKVGFGGEFANGKSPAVLEWDFAEYQPELIIINLGTNDLNWVNYETFVSKQVENKYKKVVRQETWINSYSDFLKAVREKNPDAKILCTLGLMGTELNTTLSKCIQKYITENPEENGKVFYCSLDKQKESNGYAAGWHPTEISHNEAAQKLIKSIKANMGW